MFRLRVPKLVSDKVGSVIFLEDQGSELRLHAVFKHHEAMTSASLKVFIHECDMRFPISLVQAVPVGVPRATEAISCGGREVCRPSTGHAGFVSINLVRRPIFRSSI